ncbi:sporangia induced Bardet-Biedl syndrome 4 protein [Planoprotostelium fungivorum]|uniref:Sporangia induced Bardet-Biedl syndrome 4 protein n=1 Tax=Planoprotostelium fungivorum TaxID=1890364 RepID=A0A2P6NIF3_9EUKA|nr:sporangia induced Bardet-Biedl syndrome 4 protein [Planoprotostelium fungivorum]
MDKSFLGGNLSSFKMTTTTADGSILNIRERFNWKIHDLFIKQDMKACVALIDQQLEENNHSLEYPLYMKALIKRRNGEVSEALHLFQAAAALNPSNTNNIKQIAKSLRYLLGKHKQALAVLIELQTTTPDDWEVFHMAGMCLAFMKETDKAAAAFLKANAVSLHDETYLQLGKLLLLQQDQQGAREVFLQALQNSENPEILSSLGMISMHEGDVLIEYAEHYKAFDFFNRSLQHNPKNLKTILASGSIVQDHNEIDSALLRYRSAAPVNPDSFQMWNNVGMCFFSKKKYVSAIACLKKALYHAPFEWIVHFNLGLIHLTIEQSASAFHYFSASVNLNPNFGPTYMYLGITLNRLDDFDNACGAYEKALQIEQSHLTCLNYAVTLFNRGDEERAFVYLQQFESIFLEMEPEKRQEDPQITAQYELLKERCKSKS